MPTKTGDGKDMKPIKDTFFLDGWEGKCKSGYFFRNDIGLKIEQFEKEFNKKIVGLTIDRDGWQIEFILEDQDDS